MKNQKISNFNLISVIIFTLITIFLVWYFFNIWTYQLFNKPGTETIGTFGDKFGALNTLFSGFAFAGILIALWLQRMDLNYQKDILNQSIIEMQNQIKESKEQTEQFRIQNKNMEIQKIESTFFNLLREYQNMINGIKYFDNLGRRSLINFNNTLIESYKSDYKNDQLKNYGNSIETQYKKLFNISLINDFHRLEFSVILRSFRSIVNYLEGITDLNCPQKNGH